MTHFGTISGNAQKLVRIEHERLHAYYMSGKNLAYDWIKHSALNTTKAMATYRHVVIAMFASGDAWHTNAVDGTFLDFCDDY
jgi:hypothetical protein